MEQFYVIANQYHLDFYSFRGYIKDLWLKLSLSIVTGIGFCLGFYLFFGGTANWLPLLNLKERYIALICTEVGFILIWFWTVFSRLNLVIAAVSKKLKVDSDNLNALKKLWLRSTFQASPEEYVAIAERFTKMNELQKQHKGALAYGREEFFALLYENSSKPRILALFLSLCSIVGVIVLKDANAFKLVLDHYGSLPVKVLLLRIFLNATGLLLTMFSIKFLLTLVAVLLSQISRIFKRKNSKSEYVTNYLIRDLIMFHKHKVVKVRVNSEGVISSR